MYGSDDVNQLQFDPHVQADRQREETDADSSERACGTHANTSTPVSK